MDKQKQKKLEKNGYQVGSAYDFLNLTNEEKDYIELKLALSREIVIRRQKSKLTQTELALKLKSSQSRIAKMEKGDPSVSIDLLIKSLLAMGISKKSISKVIA